MQAEERLISINDDGVQRYAFYLRAPGIEGDISKPHTVIQLLFGTESNEGRSHSEAPIRPADHNQLTAGVGNG